MTIKSPIDVWIMIISLLTFTVILFAIVPNTGVNVILEVSEDRSLNINEKIN